MTSNTLQSEPFSSVDTAWLNMDTPSNLAVITGVITFTGKLDYRRLQQTIEARLLPYLRFRQRVGEPGLRIGRPRWELDPTFDLQNHLHQISLPEPGDQSALQELVSELMVQPLQRSRPLWHIYYIEDMLDGSALIARLHHCIADGIALMQVLLSLADADPDAPWPELAEAPLPETKQAGRSFRLAARGIKAVHCALHTTGTLVHEGMDVLVHPSRLQRAANDAAAGSLALGKLLLIPPDRRTIFKQKCAVPKRVAWTTAVNLDEVKMVGQTMGGTINDVLLSAVTGGLRRYLEERAEIVQGLNIRAIVPVNLRPPEELGMLGNRFGLVFLSLPLGVKDPIRRLVLLRKRMDQIKSSPEAVVALGILNVIGLTPPQVEKIIITIFGLKGSAVMTNVPGPRQPLYMAGVPISSLIFWVPSPGNLSIGVSIFSYAGRVILGVATDAGIVPDPERIIELFQIEFEHLKSWGKPAGQSR